MTSKSKFRSVAVVAAFFCSATAFAQDNQGTPAQRLACAPDAFRVCSRYIPDAARVENCLRQSVADLSSACRSVFEQADGRQSQMSDSPRYRD